MCTVFRIINDEFSKFFGVILRTFINRKASYYIRYYTFRQSSFPGFRLDPYICFGSYNEESTYTIYDVQQQIVYSDLDGNNIRLKDIARVVKEYPHADSYIKNNGTKCILLSIEMKKGKNIVKMGEDVNKVLEEFKKEIPSEVEMYLVTNQAQVVGDSVENFLHELVIVIVAVVVVVMLLLPMRVALVAASTIPITIFISLGLFYAFGIELNTVTLAALIVTLGMIVDNSIVIIDSYLEKIGEGMSRWHASIYSAY